MKAVVGAFNQEKALVGAFSVITNLWMNLRFKLYWIPMLWWLFAALLVLLEHTVGLRPGGVTTQSSRLQLNWKTDKPTTWHFSNWSISWSCVSAFRPRTLPHVNERAWARECHKYVNISSPGAPLRSISWQEVDCTLDVDWDSLSGGPFDSSPLLD